MCHSRLKLQTRTSAMVMVKNDFFSLFWRGGGTIFHEFNTPGHSGSDMGSSPAMEQRALCPRLNEQ